MRQYAHLYRRRRLCLEPLEDRRLLSATWYEVTSIGAASIDGNALEMWDWINQMREDPQEMLYKIFDHPENLYYFDTFNASDSNTVRAAKDIAVDAAIKQWIIGDKTGEDLKACVDDFFDQWYSLQSVDPVALSQVMSQVADTHTKLMITKKTADHQLAGEDTLAERLANVSFDQAEGTQAAENIVYCGIKSGTVAGYYRSPSSYLFAAMVIDWGVVSLGHRANVMNSESTEAGISVQSTKTVLGTYVTTVDFAASTRGADDSGAYLFGLIYNDKTGDGLYTVGKNEALNSEDGYSVTIHRLSDGESVTINNTANGLAQDGAYQIYLENGSYEVSISGGSFGAGYSQKIEISGGKNVKADFLLQNVGVTKPALDLNADEEGTGTDAVFLEQATEGAKLISGDFTLSSGGRNLTKMTISFGETGRPDGANESVNVTLPENSTFRISRNTQTGELQIIGSGTEEEYRQILSSLTYLNLTEGYADLSDRTIEISVYNGLYWSDMATVTLSIVPTLLPTLSISDASVWEGDSGGNSAEAETKTLTFKAVLDAPARLDVTFNYEITDQTAVAGTNYSGFDAAGQVKIAAGETSAQIQVTVYGNYEAQDNLTMLLAVTGQPENAYWDEIAAAGTIKDDDTPVLQYAGTTAWSADTFSSFERGDRRYLYTCTTDADGLVQWSAAGPNMTITVYAGWSASACAAPVAVSKWNNGRQQVQWYAESGVKYYIKLEGSQYYQNPSLVFLAVSEDKTVMTDPLLNENGHLTAGYQNGTLTLGDGENQWSVSDNILSTLTLSASRSDAVFDFQLSDMDMLLDTVNNRLTLTGMTLILDGFSGYLFSGSDKGEEVSITGSEGNDLLNYSRGNGTLTRYADDSAKKSVYRFENITQLKFDGGGGNDTAQLYDTSSNDTASYTKEQITLAGGGYSLALKNFNTVTLDTCNGGNNTLNVTPQAGDTVTALVGKIWITGTCSFQATGLSSIQVDAEQTENPVSVLYVENENIHYQAKLGSLSAANYKTAANLKIQHAQKLILAGVEKESPQVTVTVPDDCTKTEDTNSINYKKDAYALKLTLKNKINESVSGSAFTQESSDDAALPVSGGITETVSNTESVPVLAETLAADAAILAMTSSSGEEADFSADVQEPAVWIPMYLPDTTIFTQDTLIPKKKRLLFF